MAFLFFFLDPEIERKSGHQKWTNKKLKKQKEGKKREKGSTKSEPKKE